MNGGIMAQGAGGISAITVFLQGILSFFSPCVFPLVPLYISYLAGGSASEMQSGTGKNRHRNIVLHTLFFVIGISFAFFVLGLGFTALGRFFSGNRILFSRISGILMILFGLFQLGVFGHDSGLESEHRLPFRLNSLSMNPLSAFLLGFTFSFAWTPCVGPALTGVLLMAGSARTQAMGFLLIGIYTLGFVLPFLAAGLFTDAVLGFFAKHKNAVLYTVKISAGLLIAMGLFTMTGFMNNLTQYLSSPGSVKTAEAATQTTAAAKAETKETAAAKAETKGTAAVSASKETASEKSTAEKAAQKSNPAAPDFTFTDQYGNSHHLSDYRGKIVFLNFWATWCPPCKAEMPDIQKLYEEYGRNSGDLIVLGIAGLNVGKEGNADYVKNFLADHGYTFPVLLDEKGSMQIQYGVSAFPTTFMIDKDGKVFGYVPGQMTKDIMENVVSQTMNAK